MSQTFPWVPSYGSSATMKPNVANVKFGDGYEARAGVGLNTRRRTWELTFNRASSTADQIEAFLEARNAVESFDWTPPHGAPGLWICREWTTTPTGPNTRTVSATFEEVYG